MDNVLNSEILGKNYLKLGEASELDASSLYQDSTDIKNTIDKLVKKKYIEINDVENGQFVIVSASRQVMFFFDFGVVRIYLISTAENGLGEGSGSLQTPRGIHKVKKMIGEGLSPNSILKGRIWTGDIWGEDNRDYYKDSDLVLSRVLWLDGIEKHNKASFARYIYFHGTNHPEKLGVPASHGCIRMGETEVVDFFSKVDEGLVVYILEA